MKNGQSNLPSPLPAVPVALQDQGQAQALLLTVMREYFPGQALVPASVTGHAPVPTAAMKLKRGVITEPVHCGFCPDADGCHPKNTCIRCGERMCDQYATAAIYEIIGATGPMCVLCVRMEDVEVGMAIPKSAKEFTVDDAIHIQRIAEQLLSPPPRKETPEEIAARLDEEVEMPKDDAESGARRTEALEILDGLEPVIEELYDAAREFVYDMQDKREKFGDDRLYVSVNQLGWLRKLYAEYC